MPLPLFSQTLSVGLALLTSAVGADMKSTLQAKYDAISNGFAHKDAAVLERMFGPKYVLIGTSGHKIERKELISDYKNEMTQLTDMSWPRTLENVVVSGSVATVTVRGHFSGTRIKAGVKHSFESHSVSKDTWARQNGSWVLVKSQMVSLQATYDKRPLNHG